MKILNLINILNTGNILAGSPIPVQMDSNSKTKEKKQIWELFNSFTELELKETFGEISNNILDSNISTKKTIDSIKQEHFDKIFDLFIIKKLKTQIYKIKNYFCKR